MSHQAGQPSAAAAHPQAGAAAAAAVAGTGSAATGATAAEGSKQPQQQPHPTTQQSSQPQSQPQISHAQFSSLDLATQQAILQQLAAARTAGNPAAAAFLANLNNNLNLARRTSGPAPQGQAGQQGQTPNINNATNGSASTPNISTSLPTSTAANPSAPSPSATQTPDVAALQAQLHARLIQAQQQALQAAALRQAQNAAGGGVGGAGGQQPQPGQQQQQAQSQPQQQTAQSPATTADNAPRPPSGLPDWAAAAAASGMLSNLGTDREAIMKQLQALHQSQQNRAKHNASFGVGVGSPVNPTAASPAASMTAPSPAMAAPSPAMAAPSPAMAAPSPAMAAPSPAAAAPSPAASASAPTPIATNFSADSPVVSAPSPNINANIMAALAGAVRPGATPTTPVGVGAGIPGMPGAMPGALPGAMAARPGMPVRPPFPQKQQLLNSLIGFYKSTNQQLPPEVFNGGEHDGAFKLGDVWIEITDLFLAVYRLGGLIKLMQSSHQGTVNPAEHPVWQHFLVTKGVPLTLSTPVALPKQPGMDPNAAPQMTTNPAQYLVAAYRAWIFGFEQAMTRSKIAAFQKQQQAAAAAGVRPPGAPGTAGVPTPGATPATPTAPGPPVGIPAPVPSAPTPTTQANLLASLTQAAASPQAQMAPSAPTPTAAAPTPPVAASTPPVIAPTPPAVAAPSPAPSAAPAAAPTPTPAPPTPVETAAPAPAPAPPTPTATAPSPAGPTPPARPTVEIPASQRPGSQPPTPFAVNVNGTPPSDAGTPQKRKRGRPPASEARVSTPVSAKPAGPPLPKRARYRVEYRPLNFPHPMMGGWDERVIASSFSKHRFGRPTHVAQELQVDVEAVLMGLRSRLPMEIGYGLTVLSMLSMPLHDGKAPNLPIEPLTEVYLEVLDLIAESTLGDGGIAEWLAAHTSPASAAPSRSSVSREAVERMTYAELEQLGSDIEYTVEDENSCAGEDNKRQTDIIFAGLNIIRNFSMLPENHAHMARVELFNVLAAVTDKALMRMPGEPVDSSRPYSVLEYARVCRDAVSILANLGGSFDLRQMPKPSVLAIIHLLASFLVSAWQVLQKREPGYGPSIPVSVRDVPPATILSIDRALEGFCRLTLPDHNREVVASIVPSEELVELFESLVKLFPLSAREAEALRTIDDYLARVELIALSVYSLAFLAPQHARQGMRTTAGATAVMTRLVYALAPQAADLKTSRYGILVRRVAETLGVLNGTVNPGGNADRMSFSAGGVDGKGWRFASDAVEPGWLAYDADRVLEAMGWGRGDGRSWRVDGPTFAELDGLWSA